MFIIIIIIIIIIIMYVLVSELKPYVKFDT